MGGHESRHREGDDYRYDITIFTGNKKHSGTTNNAYAILYGSKGFSRTLRIPHNHKEDFSKGHRDTHTIYTRFLGDLYRIDVWQRGKHDDQWYVEKVIVNYKGLRESKDSKELNLSNGSKDSVDSPVSRPPSKSLSKSTGKKKDPSKFKFIKKKDAKVLLEEKVRTIGGSSDSITKDQLKSVVAMSDSYTKLVSDPGIAHPSLIRRNTLHDSETLSIPEQMTKTEWHFPCYRWIDEHEELWEGTSVLPQHEKKAERVRLRNDERERKKGLYMWGDYGDHLPGFIRSKFDNLPFDERWSEEKMGDFMGSASKAGINFGIDKFTSVIGQKWKSLDDWKDFFHVLPVPKIAANWRDDEVFARQRIQGVNPTVIKRVTEWPLQNPNFQLTDDMVQGLLRTNTTIASEVKENRIYVCDLTDFAIFDKPDYLKPDRYIAVPILLLYVADKNSTKVLMPLAIMLRAHEPYHPELNPIYTPINCKPEEWILAKMFYNNTDGMNHQLSAHLMGTHLSTEPMVIAMHREMASCHPIYKLLLPHFKFQLGINCRAREILLAQNGPVDQVMPISIKAISKAVNIAYSNWRFDEASFPAMLEKRGITKDPQDLPDYLFRDDGLELWKVIRAFVKNMIKVFYLSDNDVKEDYELQNWVKEIYENGFHKQDKGWPSEVTSIKQLVKMLTTIIWTVSAQHAALNFSQYESFAFVPASPGSIFLAPIGHKDCKVKKGELTEAHIFQAMPNKDIAIRQVAMMWILSSYSSEDKMLGQYPETYFTEPQVEQVVKAYRAELAGLEAKFKLSHPDWDHLLPSKIPNSTAV